MAVYRPIGTAIGLEIEAKDITMNLAKYMIGQRKLNAVITDDGSVRHHAPTLFGMTNVQFKDNSVLRMLMNGGIYRDRAQIGAELVTDIILTSDPKWQHQVFDSLELLHSLGEGIASSTGIHVHVNGQGLPVEVLHNLIHLWQSFEAGIYRLSCGPLGYFRGAVHKDAHYCRPLTYDGPLCWRSGSDGRVQPSYTVENLLKTRSVMEFAQAYGRSDKFTTRHWHTPRYSGLNFHSLFRLGSVEFRTFNASLVPAHVLAWVELSKHIIRKAMDKHELADLPQHPYGTDAVSLQYMADVLEIGDDKLLYTLEELWNMGEFPPPLKGYRFTHLDQREGFSWGSDVRKALIPPYLDSDVPVQHWNSEQNDSRLGEIKGAITVPAFLELIETYIARGAGLMPRPRT